MEDVKDVLVSGSCRPDQTPAYKQRKQSMRGTFGITLPAEGVKGSSQQDRDREGREEEINVKCIAFFF